MIGRFSRQVSRQPQRGHRLGGLTTLRPAGRRYTTTLRKLPTDAPNAKRNNAVAIRGDQITSQSGSVPTRARRVIEKAFPRVDGFRRVASSTQASPAGSDASVSSSTSAISVAAASRMDRHRVRSVRPRP